MISIRDLRIDYDSTCAVDGLSLDIAAGEIFGLIGPNGAGKTSTMRALAGLLEPTFGQLEVHGVDVRDDPEVRTRVGFMPDFPPLYDDLLVWEFLDLFAASYGVPKSERPRVVDRHIEMVGLMAKRDFMVAELSRGMRQRVMLAKTLLPEPDVLLLDEPASGLDPHGRIQLKEILRGLSERGATVLVSSHILAEMTDFCTSIGVMERGRMVVSGAVEDVSRRVFGGSLLTIEIVGDPQPCIDALTSYGLRPELRADGTIQIVFEGGKSQSSALLSRLVRAGVTVSGFGRRKESLEDLFLQVGAADLA